MLQNLRTNKKESLKIVAALASVRVKDRKRLRCKLFSDFSSLLFYSCNKQYVCCL